MSNAVPSLSLQCSTEIKKKPNVVPVRRQRRKRPHLEMDSPKKKVSGKDNKGRGQGVKPADEDSERIRSGVKKCVIVCEKKHDRGLFDVCRVKSVLCGAGWCAMRA